MLAGASDISLLPNAGTGSVGTSNLLFKTPGSFPGVERPGSESDHSPPSNAEVKNEWSCTSITPI
jgi:hypothetical protein